MNTNSTSIAVSRSTEPGVRLGRQLRTARAALERLLGWVHEAEPVPVGPMTRAQEAAAVRECALRFSRTDPRFAADLCAAADRHEIGENV